MPIGLSENTPRECDRAVRRLLGKRASSVFPVPCREALFATDYISACDINASVTGRRLSKQTYFIMKKILELDSALTSADQVFVREVHPELVFTLVSGGPMKHAKRTPQGIRDRLRFLNQQKMTIRLQDLQRIRRRFRPAVVAIDDMVDAAACLIGAERILSGEATTLPESIFRDGRGLRMEISG